MSEHPVTDVTTADPLPADEELENDEVEEGASMDDRPDEPVDSPRPDLG